MIVEKQGGEERAAYGDGLIKELSQQMTKDFGNGYSVRILRDIRQFYIVFPKWHAMRAELKKQKSRTVCGQLIFDCFSSYFYLHYL